MYGTIGFDGNSVKGNKMLNIDSEEEGILTVSCAGGISAHCAFELPQQYKSVSHMYEISVSGLLGGHSGADIGKERLNAFSILSEPLCYIGKEYLFGSISGGGKMNVIPQSASIIIGSDINNLDELEGIIEVCNAKKLGGDTDPGVTFAVKELSNAEFTGKFFESPVVLAEIREFLGDAPTGVRKWSEDIEGLVESSLNLGVMELKDNILSADFLIRSNSDGGKTVVVDTLRSFAESIKGEISLSDFELSAEYPAWEYRKDSQLRDIMAEVYREVYGKEPVISAIHAGLECAIFSSKLKDADMVSIGPNIHDIHTPEERMEVASVARTWEYVKALLKKLSCLGAKICILTGVSFKEGMTGVMGYDSEKDEYFYYSHPKHSRSYHGTGDIFSSTCLGGIMNGLDWKKAAVLAADYTSECIRLTIEDPKGRDYGVNFEQAIPMLIKRLGK